MIQKVLRTKHHSLRLVRILRLNGSILPKIWIMGQRSRVMRDALHLTKVKLIVNPQKVMSKAHRLKVTNANLPLLKEMIVVHPLRKRGGLLMIMKDLPRVMQDVTLSKLLIMETLTLTKGVAHPNTMMEGVLHLLAKREDLPTMMKGVPHPLVKKGDHLKIKRDLHRVKMIDALHKAIKGLLKARKTDVRPKMIRGDLLKATKDDLNNMVMTEDHLPKVKTCTKLLVVKSAPMENIMTILGSLLVKSNQNKTKRALMSPSLRAKLPQKTMLSFCLSLLIGLSCGAKERRLNRCLSNREMESFMKFFLKLQTR